MPGTGVEPARPFGPRILSSFHTIPPVVTHGHARPQACTVALLTTLPDNTRCATFTHLYPRVTAQFRRNPQAGDFPLRCVVAQMRQRNVSPRCIYVAQRDDNGIGAVVASVAAASPTSSFATTAMRPWPSMLLPCAAAGKKSEAGRRREGSGFADVCRQYCRPHESLAAQRATRRAGYTGVDPTERLAADSRCFVSGCKARYISFWRAGQRHALRACRADDGGHILARSHVHRVPAGFSLVSGSDQSR
jgi:hypothetical protein